MYDQGNQDEEKGIVLYLESACGAGDNNTNPAADYVY